MAGSGFGRITGKWVVPATFPTSQATFSACWLGIDGYNNRDLIQTGTEQDYYNGPAHYSAWWEILPFPATIIPSLTIHPGDAMSAAIVQDSRTQWTITIVDDSTGQRFSIGRTYIGPRTSAEWIVERPFVNGRLAQLAHYELSTFDPGTVDGANPRLLAGEGGTMVQNGVRVSTPSVPDSDTDGFNMAYGGTAPAPPAS